MTRKDLTLTVAVSEQRTSFTLREICERGDCHAELVLKMVSYGIIEPTTVPEVPDQQGWEFDLAALIRLQKALRLQRDLNINLPGLAMSIDLLDEVDAMRREIAQLRQRLGQLYPD